MSTANVVRVGDERLITGPWRGDRRVAYVAPASARPLSSAVVREGLRALAAQGYDEVVTAALAPGEQGGFLDSGFACHERLHLLVLDLSHDRPGDLPAVSAPLRRGRRRDRAAALAVDAAAFPAFWRLDHEGLLDALRATPTSRFRVAAPDAVVGYAVTGRAADRGYIQRVAVHPDHQGRGLGTALVVDGVTWLRRRQVERVLVNTQEANHGAVRLYERLGFRRQPQGLVVLRRPLGEER